jgi:hypothetical protein
MLHLIFSPHNPDKQLGPDGKWINLTTERQIDLHGRKKPQLIFDESAWRKAIRDDGDPLAKRRLYELGKPIWTFADDTQPEIDPDFCQNLKSWESLKN